MKDVLRYSSCASSGIECYFYTVLHCVLTTGPGPFYSSIWILDPLRGSSISFILFFGHLRL